MLNRWKDCLCHPKWIGSYHKDKVGIIILTIIFFFSLYLIVFGVRSYTTEQFNEDAYRSVASAVVRQEKVEAIYQNAQLKGNTYTIEDDGFTLMILPKNEESLNKSLSNKVLIALYEDYADIYLGSFKLSSIEYKAIQSVQFDMNMLCQNQSKDIYYFKLFIADVLNSATVVLQTIDFVEGALSSLFYYLIIVLCASFYSWVINPTIDKNIRVKLVFYDGLIYFIVNMFACLFNWGWLTYVAVLFPLIYVTITFRHIVKVVVRR